MLAESVGGVLLQAQKAGHWETAKGALRAVVNVDGHKRLLASDRGTLDLHHEKWKLLNEAVERFIQQIEYEGLAE